jgi:hypothetical protein
MRTSIVAVLCTLSSPDVLTQATDLLARLRPAETGNPLATDGAQWDLQNSIRFDVRTGGRQRSAGLQGILRRCRRRGAPGSRRSTPMTCWSDVRSS